MEPTGGNQRSCPHCASWISAEAIKCGYCWKAVTPVNSQVVERSIATEADEQPSDGAAQLERARGQVIGRYADAYKVARYIVGFGSLVKVVGTLLGGAILLGTLVVNGRQPSPLILMFGVALATVMGMVLFVMGVLLSAQGQVLLATLDAAVNGSPILSLEDKAATLARS